VLINKEGKPDVQVEVSLEQSLKGFKRFELHLESSFELLCAEFKLLCEGEHQVSREDIVLEDTARYL
jgi:hypothetical protein